MAKRDKKPTEILNKTVSFNLLDPDQNADYEFANQRSNFSSYCKWLIRMERLRAQDTAYPARHIVPLPMLSLATKKKPDAPPKAETGDMMDDSLGDFAD